MKTLKKKISLEPFVALFFLMIFAGVSLVSCYEKDEDVDQIFLLPDVEYLYLDAEGNPEEGGTMEYLVSTNVPGSWYVVAFCDTGKNWLEAKQVSGGIILSLPDPVNTGDFRQAQVMIGLGMSDVKRTLYVNQRAAVAADDYISLDPEPDDDKLTLGITGSISGTADYPVFIVESSPVEWKVSQTPGMENYFDVSKSSDVLYINVIPDSLNPDAGVVTTVVKITAGTAVREITVDWLQVDDKRVY